MYLKRSFDVIVSLIGMLLLWPTYFFVAVLIWLKMSGPVFFVQKRVGRNGRLVKIHKFRSMMTLKPSDKVTGVAATETARITPLGAKLRRYKLDELPELWDVFIGNMSFVGPRPDVPGYADKLKGVDREILQLRPGITGPASLKYRNEEDLLAAVDDPQKYNDEVIWPDKVRLNRYYLNHYSFAKDIQMILVTVLGRKMKYAGETI